MPQDPTRITAREKGFAAFIRRTREKRAAVAPPPDEAPIPVEQQPLKIANVNDRFSSDDAARMASPHNPDCMVICCIDSRIQLQKALDYGAGTALEYRPISCVVPPVYKADPDLKSRMAFRRLKEISNIVMVCHSDCGGAQAALALPHPDPESEDDLHTVSSFVQRSGLDIPLLGRAFLQQESGDVKKASNHLARAIGVKSLHNLMGYKGSTGYATIADEVAVGALSINLFYFDLEKRALEMYDMGSGKWGHTPECDWFRLESEAAAMGCLGARPAVSLKKPYEILKERAK